MSNNKDTQKSGTANYAQIVKATSTPITQAINKTNKTSLCRNQNQNCTNNYNNANTLHTRTQTYNSNSIQSNTYNGSQVMISNKKVTVIQGNKSNERIKSVPISPRIKTFSLFISRIDPRTNIKDIEEMIANDIKLKVLKLVKIQSKQTKFQSYRLVIPKEQRSLAYESTAWPKGLIIRKYFYKTRQNENTNIVYTDNSAYNPNMNNNNGSHE